MFAFTGYQKGKKEKKNHLIYILTLKWLYLPSKARLWKKKDLAFQVKTKSESISRSIQPHSLGPHGW